VIKYTYSSNGKEGTPGNTIDCAVWIPVKDIYHIDYIKSVSTLVIQTDRTYIAAICESPSASKIFTMGFRVDNEGLIDKINKAFTNLKQYYRMPPK